MKFYTIKEAASIMEVSYHTMYFMVHDKKIAACKIANQYKIPHQILLDYAEQAYKPVLEKGLDMDMRKCINPLRRLYKDKE
jgi:excisionase family DNA binding protein